MEYLEIRFGDNDFGLPIEEALRRLWKYIDGNNSGPVGSKCKSFSGLTTAQIFIKLHKAGTLETLFERLYILEYLAFEVEGHTRGLYWAKVNWDEKKIKNPSEVNYKNTYLTFTFKFRKSGKFKESWQNGEYAYLNLKNGEVSTF